MVIGTGNAGQLKLPAQSARNSAHLSRSGQVLSDTSVVSAGCVVPLSERELRVEILPEVAERGKNCEKNEVDGQVVMTFAYLSTSGDGAGCRISVEANQNVLENKEETLVDEQDHVCIQHIEST